MYMKPGNESFHWLISNSFIYIFITLLVMWQDPPLRTHFRSQVELQKVDLFESRHHTNTFTKKENYFLISNKRTQQRILHDRVERKSDRYNCSYQHNSTSRQWSNVILYVLAGRFPCSVRIAGKHDWRQSYTCRFYAERLQTPKSEQLPI